MSNYIHPLQQHHVVKQGTTKQPVRKDATTPFKDIMNQVQTPSVKVSKHAQARIAERNIQINEMKWQAIGDKMNEAKSKGITDALVLTEDAALVVSTKNHTVVTALHQDEAANKIFTNINGTILL